MADLSLLRTPRRHRLPAQPGPAAPAAAPALGAGHGIVGMRERAGLYGGQFHAGPLPGGGFRVTARLPLDSPAGQPATATDAAQSGSP